jgi:hypothetical protein
LAKSSVYWQYFKILNFFGSYKSIGNTKEIVIVSTTLNPNFKSFISNWCHSLQVYCHNKSYLGLLSNKKGFSFKKPNLKFIKIKYNIVIFLSLNIKNTRLVKEARATRSLVFGFSAGIMDDLVFSFVDAVLPIQNYDLFSFNWVFTLIEYSFSNKK